MKPVRTALCSFGMSGKVFHAPFIQLLPQFELYSVWERSKQLAAQSYPHIKSVATYEELLADESVELVVVNTPNFTHYEYAKQALLAGKHVLVEKPFTTTVAEAEELAVIAKEKGKVLALYHNRRWDSDFKTVQQVLQENRLGKIVEAEIHFDRYKLELSPKQHKETPQLGTGVLYDLGAHLIDQALVLFGMPQKVFADLRIVRPASQVDDYFELLLYYPELRVRLHSSYTVREAGPGFILHGTNGSFLKSRADVQEVELTQGIIPESSDWGTEPEEEQGLLHTEQDGIVIREKLPTLQGNYAALYEGLYEAIRNGAPAPVTAADGINNLRIIEAAQKSSEQGCVISL